MAFFQCEIFSQQLEMYTNVNMIIPQGVVNPQTPVVYLLHGLSDNAGNWVRYTSVERYANRHRVAVVIPEVQRSFYSDMKYGIKYFSYISCELIQFVSSMFNLPTSKELSFIAGLSMGGFGAMKCAFTKPEQYNAVAAFSPVCDIEDLIVHGMNAAKAKELFAIMGSETKIDPENDLYALAKSCADKGKIPRLFMTCGTNDLLYSQNLKLRAALQSLGANLTINDWQEDHTWEFWDKSIELALEFFFGKGVFGTKTPLSDGV